MFIEFETRKLEVMSINLDNVLYITPYKTYTLIVDVYGEMHYANESYPDFISRVRYMGCDVGQNYSVVKQDSFKD